MCSAFLVHNSVSSYPVRRFSVVTQPSNTDTDLGTQVKLAYPLFTVACRVSAPRPS